MGPEQTMTGVDTDEHGRQATAPTEIPARGWKDVLVRTKAEVKQDRVSLVSAGVAFYGLLAMVPALLAVVCGPASLWTRLGMGGAFVVAAFCVMQARAQTCVLLAYTGRRNLDGGSERVRDLDQRRELISAANLVVVKALAIALAGMAVLALV